MNSAEVDRLQVRDPRKEKRRSSGVLEAWPLRTSRVLTPSTALLVITHSILITGPGGQFKYRQVIRGPY